VLFIESKAKRKKKKNRRKKIIKNDTFFINFFLFFFFFFLVFGFVSYWFTIAQTGMLLLEQRNLRSKI
jgi:hypothetical protein